jgi:hypothetical protein
MYRALFAAFAAALLVACGGSSGSAPTQSADFGAAAREAADSALMRLTDLPQFWTVGNLDDTNLDVELSPECDVFDTDVSFPGAAASNDSPPYDGTEERMATFLTAAYQEEAAATAAFDGLDLLVERCRPEFLEAIDEAARQEAEERGFGLGPFGRVDVALDDQEFIPLGDQSQTLRVFVEVRVLGIGTDFTLDIIAVRVGRMMGAMTYSNFGDLDPVEEELIARDMTAKLAAADATLPEVPAS